MTVSKPVVSSTQNGPGTADTETTYFDGYGYPIWRKDGDGFLHYTAFDTVTGAVTKSIVDVDTTQTSDFANLPSGWSTPSGGGLHLNTTMEVDGLARTTKLTDPNGNITYTVYKDTNHEVRVYAGWNTSTNAPTGPTQVYREDRPGSYIETLTMSATPSVTDGKPTGTESIGSVQTLSRTQISDGGQVTRRDALLQPVRTDLFHVGQPRNREHALLPDPVRLQQARHAEPRRAADRHDLPHRVRRV